MPNLDNLLDMVAEKLDTEEGEAWFSSIDETYAYGQVPFTSINSKTLHFSDNRWRIHRNVSIRNKFLRSVGYADRVSKSNG